MNDLSIELNQQAFTGGDTLAGEVTLRLAQDTPLRGIRLMLKGYEQASWREGSGKHRHTHWQTRDLFEEAIILHGDPPLPLPELMADSIKAVFSKEHYEVLPAGTYHYPFSYVLPPDLPGNYESALTNSRISYDLKAQVDLPLKLDLRARQPLAINEPITASRAHTVTERTTKKFLFDADSLVEAAVHLDTDTFRVGEALRCQVEVFNRAPGKDIHGVTLALRQIETLKAEGRTDERDTELLESRFEGCRFPLKERSTVNLELPLPKNLCPTVGLGKLVKLDYAVKVVLDIPWAVDAKLLVPVTLVRARSLPADPPRPADLGR